MLNEYPIFFDDTEIMPWSKWEESSEVVENTYQTEAGTDQLQVVRYDKLNVSAEYRCQSEWLQRFAAFAEQDEINVKMYDAKLMDYKTRKMRMRNFKKNPIEFSDRLKDTNGVWNVSFDLEEF